MTDSKKSYLAAAAAIIIWGTLASTVKVLTGGMSDLQVLAVSGWFGGFFLLIWALAGDTRKYFRDYSPRDYFSMAWLGFIGLFTYSALYYYGLSQLSAQEACILNYLWPVTTILFSCLILKEPFTARKAVATMLSFAGIVVVMAGRGEAGRGNAAAGIAACVMAAVCYGFFSAMNKKKAMNQNITMMVVWFVTGAAASGLCALRGAWSPVTPLQLLGLAYLGVVVQALANLFWAVAVNRAKNTALVANLAFLVPFLSVVVSTTMLHEPLSLSALAALILIVSGILIQSGVIRFGKLSS
ncbi:MAG: DMT family transporter [Clostridium sp.]|nr:DMT family transporter [Clostridium sp.]